MLLFTWKDHECKNTLLLQKLRISDSQMLNPQQDIPPRFRKQDSRKYRQNITAKKWGEKPQNTILKT